jgi:hypothetical protein
MELVVFSSFEDVDAVVGLMSGKDPNSLSNKEQPVPR